MTNESERIVKALAWIDDTVSQLTTSYLEEKIESVKEEKEYRRGLLDGGVISTKSAINRLKQLKSILGS